MDRDEYLRSVLRRLVDDGSLAAGDLVRLQADLGQETGLAIFPVRAVEGGRAEELRQLRLLREKGGRKSRVDRQK